MKHMVVTIKDLIILVEKQRYTDRQELWLTKSHFSQ